MTKAILPDGVRLLVNVKKKARSGQQDHDVCQFLYEETFKKADLAAVKQTVEAVRTLVDGRLKVTFRRNKRGVTVIRMRGDIERNVVGDMLMGEFLGWSTISGLNFRDLVIAGVMYRAHAAQQAKR